MVREQLGPQNPDLVLGKSAWSLPDLEYRVVSVLARIQVD